jgi:hypothetical protein
MVRYSMEKNEAIGENCQSLLRQKGNMSYLSVALSLDGSWFELYFRYDQAEKG